MKKIVMIVGVLLVIGLLGATWYSSFQTEKLFVSQVEKSGELSGPAIKVNLDEYARGFLQSRAKTSVSLGKAASLHLVHKITHLPWGTRVVTTIDDEAYHDGENGESLPLEQLQVLSHFSLTGKSDMQMKIPAIETEQDGLRISLADLEVNGSLNAGMDDGAFDLRIDSFQVQTSESRNFAIDDVHGVVHYREQGGFPLGDGVLQLEKISAIREGVAGYVMTDLAYRYNSTLADRRLNQYVDITFEDLAVADETCRKGRLKFDITGMDADAVQGLQEAYGGMSAEALAGREVDPFLVQLQIMAKTMELLQKGIHAKLETLALETSDGAINAQGFIDVENMQQDGGPAFDLKSLRAGATLHVDAGAFAAGYRLASALRGVQLSAEELRLQADALLQTLVAQGVLVQSEDGGLTGEFAVADGAASLNGKPVSR